ncbi:MAG TPA: hypothetical protein VIU61_05005 [Kofleriaceae bacterium]
MKVIASVLVCALVACGGGSKTGTETAGSAAGGGQPCTQEIALVCPEGQIDACLKATAGDELPAVQEGDEESGGSGTAMALDEGKMGKLEAAGTHRCVPK